MYVMGGAITFNRISISNKGKWRWESISTNETHPPTHWMECPNIPEEFEGIKEDMNRKVDEYYESKDS